MGADTFFLTIVWRLSFLISRGGRYCSSPGEGDTWEKGTPGKLQYHSLTSTRGLGDSRDRDLGPGGSLNRGSGTHGTGTLDLGAHSTGARGHMGLTGQGALDLGAHSTGARDSGTRGLTQQGLGPGGLMGRGARDQIKKIVFLCFYTNGTFLTFTGNYYLTLKTIPK